MRTTIVSVATALMLLMGTASEAVELTVTPQQGFEPITFSAVVTVEKDADNRALCLDWTSGSSCYNLEGDYAPVTHRFKGRLSAGVHEFVARVYKVVNGEGRWERSRAITVNVLEGK